MRDFLPQIGLCLPVQSNDDMGFLVRSFNDMTKRVAIAQAEVRDQHKYLDSILEQLSAGVIALNSSRGMLTGLIALHVGAALFHHYGLRDGMLKRMGIG